MFILGIVSTASANADIAFSPANVYFADNGKLVVTGVLINKGNQNGIVDTARLEVYRVDENGQSLLTSANFANVNAFVPAGGTLNWQFNISGVSYTEIGHWRVVADLGYRW
ncbi:hypothetical protein [Pelosinus propionicus]|uniref:hypothetical protein n=1 Tax=Pelosinus propionicus TaxID=380084 RepID=UPI0015878F86|nr:hypothetical protein [Pelosinus propionicus]